MIKFLHFFLLLCVLISCSKDETPVTPVIPEEPIPYPYTTPHFTFYYTSYDSLFMHEIADTVENNYSRILSDLLTDSVLKTSVHFYRTHAELADAVRYVVPNLPVWATGLATAKDTIHMLAPKHPEVVYNNALQILVHEFAHCVTINIKSNFPNNPRWLWESIAIYESRQFVHPNQLTYMVNHTPPTLNQLNGFNNTQIYEVGYLLAEYIVLHWDWQHLKSMILSNGNVQQTLGVSVADFQTNWFDFVRNRYGI